MTAKQTPDLDALRDRAGEAYETARERASDAYDNARERAIDAYDTAREKAVDAGNKARDGIDKSPLLALGGGLALGALIAALLPKTKTEEKLIGSTGRRITDTAKSAASAAKTAGQEKLAELNITKDAGSNAVQSLLKGLGDAAKSGSQAAIGTIRKAD
nr:hypothetical protein [uncultured Sphingomonas sp.]